MCFFVRLQVLGSSFDGNKFETGSNVNDEENLGRNHPLSTSFSQFSFLKKSTEEFVHDQNSHKNG